MHDAAMAADRRDGLLAALRSRRLMPLPTFCRICSSPTAASPVCAACAASAYAARLRCPRCAVERPAIADLCVPCRRSPPHFDAAYAGGEFDAVTRIVLLAMKFDDEPGLAGFLAQRLADALLAAPQRQPVDVLMALPLAPQRLRERGYNQSLLLARALLRDARLQAAPRLLTQTLLRVGDRPAQAALSPAARRSNVKDVFVAAQRLDGLRIALVDDVMTTGATFDAAAHACKRAGAAWVEAWTALRTPL
jgi:ComF family protein